MLIVVAAGIWTPRSSGRIARDLGGSCRGETEGGDRADRAARGSRRGRAARPKSVSLLLSRLPFHEGFVLRLAAQTLQIGVAPHVVEVHIACGHRPLQKIECGT